MILASKSRRPVVILGRHPEAAGGEAAMDLLVMAVVGCSQLLKSEHPLIPNQGRSQSIGHGTKRVRLSVEFSQSLDDVVELGTDSGSDFRCPGLLVSYKGWFS